MKYSVSNIKYDTADCFGLIDDIELPTEMIVECDSIDEIADKISDETNFLVESFVIESAA